MLARPEGLEPPAYWFEANRSIQLSYGRASSNGDIVSRTPHVLRRNRGIELGYTSGMKTAISMPDDVFRKAERLARRTKKSRSQVFTEAVREYIARHAPDEVTDAVNRVCEDLRISPDESGDEFVASAARQVLQRTEW